MANILKRHLFPVVALVVFVILVVIAAVTTSGNSATLADQEAELDALVTQARQAQTVADMLTDDATRLLSGATSERLELDHATIEELLERALTWSDNAEYTEARAATKRVYDLADDSVFMTSFLPPAPFSVDSKGNQYPYIDAAGLNSKVGGFQPSVLRINGLSYEYMVLVDVRSDSSDGRGAAVNVATVFLTIDGEGGVSDLRGYAATSLPVTSH